MNDDQAQPATTAAIEWRKPDERPRGGQCLVVDENGDVCAGLYIDGKWYECLENRIDPELEMKPRFWARYPEAPHE